MFIIHINVQNLSNSRKLWVNTHILRAVEDNYIQNELGGLSLQEIKGGHYETSLN